MDNPMDVEFNLGMGRHTLSSTIHSRARMDAYYRAMYTAPSVEDAMEYDAEGRMEEVMEYVRRTVRGSQDDIATLRRGLTQPGTAARQTQLEDWHAAGHITTEQFRRLQGIPDLPTAAQWEATQVHEDLHLSLQQANASASIDAWIPDPNVPVGTLFSIDRPGPEMRLAGQTVATEGLTPRSAVSLALESLQALRPNTLPEANPPADPDRHPRLHRAYTTLFGIQTAVRQVRAGNLTPCDFIAELDSLFAIYYPNGVPQ